MADFGVAHLPCGQTDIETARAQFAAGIIAIELDRETASARASVASPFFSRLRAAAGINSPAVANQEHDRLRHRRRMCRRSRCRHKRVLSLTSTRRALLHRAS